MKFLKFIEVVVNTLFKAVTVWTVGAVVIVSLGAGLLWLISLIPG